MKMNLLSASIVLSAAIATTGIAISPATFAASRATSSHTSAQAQTITPYPVMSLLMQSQKKLNGTADTIRVYGEPFSPGAPYFKKLLLTITSDNHGSATFIPLSESGYKPTISYPHLTSNSATDIFVDSGTGGNGILSTDYLFAYQKGAFVGIAMPPTPLIQVKLLNQYRIQFQIPSLKKTVVMSIQDKKSAYDQAGVYHNGKLVKPFSPMIIPIGFFKPVVQKSGSTILQGAQEISGMYHADGIASVFWNWQWTASGWKLLNATIQK